MRGNTSPAPSVGSAPRGGVLNPKRATPFNKKKKVIFIFVDDIFICNLDGGFFSRYSVENNNLIATNPRGLDDGGWEDLGDENEIGKIQHVFSGDRLILVFDGEPITLSKYYTDFLEW
jgi:hypothetical protein